ncbi:hypothetical protein [Nocardia sp. NPDC019395]|uniref:hypothetical protein n=1 Tax=Nocardia sp. NPDC019395 TaxID=3154686 RepID=UPI0033D70119
MLFASPVASDSANFRPVGEVLDGLDGVFARAKRPGRIDACPCCLRPDKIEVLLRRPRKMLSADDIRQYATVAMLGAGSAADLRYFTPRILELCHTGEMDFPDIEIVYDHMRRADWESWPEAPAIVELMNALWAEVLARYPDSDDPGVLLCAFGTATGSVVPNLASWSCLETAAAVHSLRDFLSDHVVLRHGTLVPDNPFWDTAGNAHHEVVRWLNGGEAGRAVDRILARGTDDHDLSRSLVESRAVLSGCA